MPLQQTSAPLSEHHVGDAPMLIGAAWTEAADGRWIDVESPRDKTVLGRVPRGGAEDVARAVTAAAGAFPGWRDRRPKDRGDLFRQIADALEPEQERIARLLSLENGNAIRTQSRGEMQFVVDCFRYFSGLAGEAKGESIPLNPLVLDYSRREPLGVVGAIVPWNAPLMLSALKIAPALVSGNTLVLKLAEDAPLAVLAVVQVCARFLPPGVLNVVTGYGREAGEALTSHPGVAKLSFTGSTAVGRRVMEKGAERIVPVSLELGGKSPQIVFPDADENWVVDGTIAGMRFFRQGQSCTAGSRLFIHETVFDSFLDKLVAKLKALRVGDPLDETSDMGTIVNGRQFDRVCEYVASGIDHPGADVALGGLPPTDGPLSRGYYLKPTVFATVDNSWRVAAEEIFGPVVCAIPWKDEEDVVRMANDTHYGLAGFVWTHDLGAALRTAHALEAGWVQVNQGGGQVLGQSYGGFKQSGIGREFSLEGMLDSYTQRKHVSVNLER
ncbi:aldehyde dehydrogenase family protein [Streptomyces sp. NBC_00841]|uniref:aldehyde dehydrogenase family protein n=1 Tax=Streptomyces sp. NBC_00841 TaxID=2975847 RepID=UPI002DD963D2|nr:aldehyde dehydrogenase family protein [Streptomyces sp. NBC_00841]WSA03379.1 aldehyde dehydrogenase family protein [Streptomyces sp. NBC_00841]